MIKQEQHNNYFLIKIITKKHIIIFEKNYSLDFYITNNSMYFGYICLVQNIFIYIKKIDYC